MLAGGEDLQQGRQRLADPARTAPPSDSGLRVAAKKRSRLFNAMSGSLSVGRCSPSCWQMIPHQVQGEPMLVMLTRLPWAVGEILQSHSTETGAASCEVVQAAHQTVERR